MGQLSPATNPGRPARLGTAARDGGRLHLDLNSPAQTHAGGAYRKVVRWAFEKQGVFRAPGQPVTVEGKPPAVDVYIDDGRHGEYPFQAKPLELHGHLEPDRRRAPAEVCTRSPSSGTPTTRYVRIKNRGTQAATNIVVKGFHCLPGVGLEFPTDWVPMTTSLLPAPNLAANNSVGVVVGPFQWTPSQVGHECMFFSVYGKGDAGNIDGHVVGPIPEWRLVPHDNNIGQRNVHPVNEQSDLVRSGRSCRSGSATTARDPSGSAATSRCRSGSQNWAGNSTCRG